MTHDYCVVGPRFVLRGAGESGAGELTLTAEDDARDVVAYLSAVATTDARVRVLEPQAVRPLMDDEAIELLRLFVRVCVGFWSYRYPIVVHLGGYAGVEVERALAADGFVHEAGTFWTREARPFERQGPKATTADEIYDDLFSVPWNVVPREWDVLGAVLEPVLDSVLDPVLEDAREMPLTVLDLGCGLGKNVEPLEARGFSVFGVDRSHRAIARCRRIVGRPERFVVGSGAHLPWRSATFQRVLDIGSLHCMPAEVRALAVPEIARVLSRNGLVYSRFFTPRPAEWVRLHPQAVDRFGLSVEDVRALFDGVLTCESIEVKGPAIYVKARKR